VCVTAGNFPATNPYFSFAVAYGAHIASSDHDECADRIWSEHTFEAEAQMNVYILTS
jgi:hypothetical protein